MTYIPQISILFAIWMCYMNVNRIKHICMSGSSQGAAEQGQQLWPEGNLLSL